MATDGIWYTAEVSMVSTAAKRVRAPVKVHFLGYNASHDEWVTADNIRSKALKHKRLSSSEPNHFSESEQEAGLNAETRTHGHPDDAEIHNTMRHGEARTNPSSREVNVLQLGEHICSVSISLVTLVGDVKYQIYAKMGIPIACQVLVVDPVAFMDNTALLGDIAESDSITLVVVKESGESVCARLQGILEFVVNNEVMRYGSNEGDAEPPTFFNIEIVEGNTAEEEVMGFEWTGECSRHSAAFFRALSELTKDHLREWFQTDERGTLPDDAKFALDLLSDQGADGGGCITFARLCSLTDDGVGTYTVGVCVVTASECVVGWQQEGVVWTRR